MDKTANYNLPQWVGTDPIRMKPFNDAFDGIDKALKANADAAQALQSGKADGAATGAALAALTKNLGTTGPVTTAAWRSARTSATAMSGRPRPPRSQARFIRCSC